MIFDKKRKDYKTQINLCDQISELLNLLIKGEEIPKKIICTRFICLNKCLKENSKLDNISSIAITGILIKILEKIILNRNFNLNSKITILL